MYSVFSKRVVAVCAGVVVSGAVLAPATVPPASASNFVVSLVKITSPTTTDPHPVEVEVDTDTNQAYVANTFDGTVSVIDTRTNEVTTTIPHGPAGIGVGPTEIAIDRAHAQAYVANYTSGTVSVIDTASNTTKKVIAHDSTRGIGTRPSAVEVDAGSGRAYVTNAEEGTVSVIDTASNAVTTVIPHDPVHGIGSTPSGVGLDPTTHRAYVSNYSDGTVSVIDTLSNAVISVLPHDSATGIGSLPSQVAVDATRHRALVTNLTEGTVTVIDTTTDKVIGVIAHDTATGIGDYPANIGIESISGQAYVTAVGQISVINVDTLSVTRILRQSPGSDYGYGLGGISMDAMHGHALIASPAANAVAVIDLERTVSLARRGGADRFQVSATNSAAEFAPGVAVAYIASGSTFADALSGSAAAGKRGAPVLLTAPDAIPTVIGAELARLKPARIVILGGIRSVGDQVEQALRGYTAKVDRLAGADRYEVAAAVSRDTFSTAGIPVAYLASGEVFPDALSGSAVAAHHGAPVLLSTKDGLPKSTADELARLKPGRVVILGGSATISAAVESQIQATIPTMRIQGADRFEVSANASASTFTSGSDVVFIASGTVFPDALSGSPAASANGGPVLLVAKDAIPESIGRELTRLKPHQIIVLGGTNTIDDSVYQRLRSYIR